MCIYFYRKGSEKVNSTRMFSGEEWDRARILQSKMEENLRSTMTRMDELGSYIATICVQ